MPVTNKQFELDKQEKLDFQSLLQYWLGDDTISQVTKGPIASELNITNEQTNSQEVTIGGVVQPVNTIISIWAEPAAAAVAGQVYRAIINFTTSQSRSSQCYFDFKIVE